MTFPENILKQTVLNDRCRVDVLTFRKKPFFSELVVVLMW